MDNFISILRDANSLEELESYKVALFKENVRLRTDQSEIEEMKEQIENSKKELENERKAILEERKALEEEKTRIKKELEKERKKLEEDAIFFGKKQMVLDRAYKQLDADRRRLDSEKSQFYKMLEENRNGNSASRIKPLEYRQGLFFKGITNPLALKKRYKDLIKVFHPDNLSGDNETLSQINREYEILKHDMNIGKQEY